MKKLLGFASAAALIAGLPLSASQAGVYVEGSAGVTTQDDLEWGGSTYDMDDGWNAGVAIGTSMWTNWDVEAEFSYNESEDRANFASKLNRFQKRASYVPFVSHCISGGSRGL